MIPDPHAYLKDVLKDEPELMELFRKVFDEEFGLTNIKSEALK